MFKFELERGEMENKSLSKQLNQVIIYEQVENGVAINRNVNAYHID